MSGHDFAHNGYANAARERKAVALETLLAGRGFTSSMARACSPDDRRWFARVAGVNPPSDETWARVVELLASAEASPARAGSDG